MMHNQEHATIRWEGGLDGAALIIDQTKLPRTKEILAITRVEGMWDAIYHLKIRGAPAIGIAAAFGVVLGIRGFAETSVEKFLQELEKIIAYLETARPTAVNLFWAVKRMRALAVNARDLSVAEIKLALWREACRILEEDVRMCHAIGDNGADLIREGANVLTHCNAGGLATSGYGTALAVLFSAWERQTRFHVYADETRPLWQGARLTSWELMEAGIPVTLICDNTAAFLMQQGKVDIAIVGADRIAANGDTANKIGTYSVAVNAAAHGVPFYVAAPSSTLDPGILSGKDIPIEERPAWEVVEPCGRPIAPEGIDVYAPAFDVTPARYIAGIVTEHGVLRPPFADAIANIEKNG